MERKMSRNLFSSLTFTVLILLLSCLYQAIANSSGIERSRQVLEIGIGIGGSPSPALPPDNGDCPDCDPPPACPEPAPPPPPECPPPPPPPKKSPPPPPPPPKKSPPPPPPPPPKKSPPPPPPPPPPPKKSPPPPPPPSNPPGGLTKELKQNIIDIQRFKKLITRDPLNITATWVGNGLCVDKTKYKGFVCDTTRVTKQPRIAGVKFNGYNFDGNFSLDNFLGNFEGQIFFHANSNFFKGGVPAVDFKRLRTLYEFDMSNNKLAGGFPEAVFAGNLTFLDLRFNQFTGKVPPQAFNLDLDALFLNNNKFYGEIPSNLGNTPAVYLTLANNMFTGPIPTSIGNTANTLLEVLLLNNRLSGCLPYQIGLLKNTEVFDASKNELTGPIPMSFGCLQHMQTLDFSYNNLYGAVPEELCSVKSLDKLNLKFNYFTQVGPKCRELIKKGTLDLSMNCIIDLDSQRKPDTCKSFFLKHPNDNCPLLLTVPCKIGRSATQLTDKPATKKPSKHSRTYAALHRHHQ